MTNTVAKHMINTQGLLDAIRMYIEPITLCTATEAEKKNFLSRDCHIVVQLLNVLDERFDEESGMAWEVEDKYSKLSSQKAKLDSLVNVLNTFKIDPVDLDDEES